MYYSLSIWNGKSYQVSYITKKKFIMRIRLQSCQVIFSSWVFGENVKFVQNSSSSSPKPLSPSDVQIRLFLLLSYDIPPSRLLPLTVKVYSPSRSEQFRCSTLSYSLAHRFGTPHCRRFSIVTHSHSILIFKIIWKLLNLQKYVYTKVSRLFISLYNTSSELLCSYSLLSSHYQLYIFKYGLGCFSYFLKEFFNWDAKISLEYVSQRFNIKYSWAENSFLNISQYGCNFICILFV